MEFKFDILETKEKTIVKTGEKIFYNLDTRVPLYSWVPKHDKKRVLGYLVSDSNNLEKSLRSVYFLTEKNNNNNRRFVVGENNIMECFVNFTVRKLPSVDWINEKDEFLSPTQPLGNFAEDSLVYSLFNNSSYQTSKPGAPNHFFWLSVNQMVDLANETNYNQLYNNARTSENRHVYELLFGEKRVYDKLSSDAKEVLDYATNLIKLSLNERECSANENNNLDYWDAGYSQLKNVWKESFPNEFKTFRELYKKMEDRMRPLVYELGFLIK